MNRHQAHEQLQRALQHIHSRIMGQTEIIQQLISCFLAQGHILLTGAPGLGKTLMIKEFGQYLGISFKRIQYTPDLLPSDITGSEIIQLHQDSAQPRQFKFIKGPLFAHLVLADEINRAAPRTQAAMLEAMQERAVTYLGKHYQLPSPFMVCATQNPLESQGTYPLPEAQLDRFLIHALVDYPTAPEELAILENYHKPHATEPSQPPAWSPATITSLLEHASSTPVSDEILELVCTLIRATRNPVAEHQPKSNPDHFNTPVRFGAGPRGGLALITTAKALALILGDPEVRWHHIKQLIGPVLRHRISLHPGYARQVHGVDGFLKLLTHQLEDQHNLLKQAI